MTRDAVVVLAPAEIAAGFALAGLRTVEAASSQDAVHRLLALAGEPDVGVLLVPDELLDRLPDADRRALLGQPLPIVVPFPTPRWQEGGRDAQAYILEILQRAIGYRVRLQ